jgi:antitoxin HigA-1
MSITSIITKELWPCTILRPGEVIRELCLEPLELSVTEAAKALGVTRKSLSEVLNGRAGVSPVMAPRLAKAFATSAERWLAMQQQYDLWQARKAVKLGRVQRLVERRKAAG